MKEKKTFRPAFELASLVLVGLLFTFLAADCGSTPEPPTEAVEVAGWNYKVKRDRDKAWATLTVVDHFDELTDAAWHWLIYNGLVTTDDDGQAQLCPSSDINAGTGLCADVACHIWVFEATDFGPFCCPEEDLGTDLCSCHGTGSFDDCPFTVVTLSADVTGLGTWFSVTYLWDSQVTLVIVGEGAVEVTPVRTLAFEGEIPPLDELDPPERAPAWRELGKIERDMGEPEVVDVEAEGGPQFFYTAPDAMLDKLDLGPEVPQPRQWQPVEELPYLIEELRPIEPRLEPWRNSVWQQARVDGIYLPPQEEQLSAVTAGEQWQSKPAQEALLYAVDWAALTQELFDQNLPVRVSRLEPTGDMTPVHDDARQVGYDPERARMLLDEAGLAEGSRLILLVPEEDESLLKMAELMAEQLAAIGVETGIVAVPASRADAQMATVSQAGKPVLWLSRQP